MAAQVAGCTAVVTGANRGIGRAFVEELVAQGAARVYAGARDPDDLGDLTDRPEVVPLRLDVTDPELVAAAARNCGGVDVLINNAGYFANQRLIQTEDPDAARREMEVNYFGVLAMTRAFAPVLGSVGGGAILNVLSVAGSIPTAFMGGYSTSKAATLFLSTITRAELEPQGTTVTALVVGSVDTRMAAHVDGPKESPTDIVRTGLRAMERGERVRDTDAMAVQARASYALDPVRHEQAMARLLRAEHLSTRR